MLSDTDTADAPALEICCARSRWRRYFARRFAFEVSGLDYSVAGCEQVHAVARKTGVDARIVCADLFAPPEDMLDHYAFVYSNYPFGVVEDFEDTAGILRDMTRFMRPGVIIVTIVLNLTGATGALMRRFNRANYDQHVPLGRTELAAAHSQARLELIATRWVGTSQSSTCTTCGAARQNGGSSGHS